MNIVKSTKKTEAINEVQTSILNSANKIVGAGLSLKEIGQELQSIKAEFDPYEAKIVASITDKLIEAVEEFKDHINPKIGG